MILGKNVIIGKNVKFLNLKGEPLENGYIGDNSFIGDDVQIICDNFFLGDYCKLHHHINIHGKKVTIGHNAWVGQYTIIDGLGETTIGNNCGIGAHSQLWSHIKYGDTLAGCRFNSASPLVVEDDVWFVGHCIVSPIRAKSKSMAFVGSVVTKDMEENHIYAGSPAKDISDKVGFQFIEIPLEEKINKMNYYLSLFPAYKNIEIISSSEEILKDDITYFNVSNRKYTKRLTQEEISFMRFLLPEKAKYIPCSQDEV